MPRPTNFLRIAARDAGETTYLDITNPCCLCGCDARYTANAQCVDCSIAKGKARYRALDEAALVEQKRKDHDRYIARKL